ncbi:MAG: hypothetical protein R3F55_00255 [Alphaproteobacteria bacterium]
MAITTQQSAQLALLAGEPARPNPVHDWGGRMRIALFDFAQAGVGDAGSLAELVKLPAGHVRLILPLSRIAFSAMGASRTMDVGWAAHAGHDGTPVAADPDGLDAAVAVSSAGAVNPSGTVGAGETVLFGAQAGLTLTARIGGGTVPDGATLNGWFVYVVD